MSLREVKIIDRAEAERLVQEWPTDVSFGQKFSRLHNVLHGFKSGYVLAEYEGGSLIFPVQWGNRMAYSVHKGHTMPLMTGARLFEPDWMKIAREVRRLTNSNIYIADLAVSKTMTRGLNSLPSAIFILDTSSHDIDTLFGACNKTTRNLIRRSQEQGFRIEIMFGEMSDEWYGLYVYHQRTMGTPPRPKKYFDDVANVFGEGFVIIGAYDQHKPIGMNLLWCDDGGIWLSINSSLSEYTNRHINYLLYYEMIKWACENNINRIDFGGSPTRDGNIHNTFKLGFGADMKQLYRLTNGTLPARIKDLLNRKKRNLHIRWNKLWK